MSEAREAIAAGSKSFFLASWFFPSNMRSDVWALYRWCRHCDDVVDAGGREGAAGALAKVRAQTLDALKGESADAIFRDLGAVCRTHQIPSQMPSEMLAGFSKDATGAEYLSIEDVEIYAYQVAGVVGVMMTSIMGARSQEALSHAIALGNAMQLTNIARDVAEDHRLGRVYLPRQWLTQEGVSLENLLAPQNREGLYRVVLRILDRADALYAQGYRGLRYLPFRASVAVAAAGEIYARIGAKIRCEGPSALDRRVYVGAVEKILLAFKGVWRALRSRL